MLEDWTIYSWYCPNCRNEVAGLKNSKNQIRVKCKTCGSEMVRTIVGRRHDVIDIYAPSGQERNDLELREHRRMYWRKPIPGFLVMGSLFRPNR